MLTYLIRTNSLDSDDRFVKTLAFLDECEQKVEVFAVVKKLSRHRGDFIERQLSLRARFRSGHLVMLKYLELIFVTCRYLLRARGRRWFANFDFLPLHFLVACFASSRNRPIWDLHEMPPLFIERNPILRSLFACLLKRSHVIVCNEARRSALADAFGVCLDSALILRNFPSEITRLSLVSARNDYLSRTSVKEDVLSVIIIGGNAPGRFVAESVETIATLRRKTGLDIRVSLVGGEPLVTAHNFVTSTGFISFNQLISDCVKGGVALCFYKMNTSNNLLCEPNRFYQSLLVGQDVLTFAHPSLEKIESLQRHIVDESDFSASLENILKRLIFERLSADRQTRAAIVSTPCDFVFESQLSDFANWLPR